jgi:hypothetical protein
MSGDEFAAALTETVWRPLARIVETIVVGMQDDAS